MRCFTEGSPGCPVDACLSLSKCTLWWKICSGPVLWLACELDQVTHKTVASTCNMM